MWCHLLLLAPVATPALFWVLPWPLALQDQEANAREFLREFGITYPNGRDVGAKIAIDYGVWGLPETFFIDREGRITCKHVGALGWNTITAKLDEALQGVVSASEGRGEYRSIR